MEIPEYKNMYKAEDSHFYYVSLHKTILSLVRRYTEPKGYKNLHILDAGCGTGRLAEMLKTYGEVIGIDMSDEALHFAKRRGIKTQKASITKLPFKDNTFDIVTSIDVLVSKEVEPDTKALEECYRVLKPNGIFILRVSAIPWLQVSHDKFVHSNKRYTRKILKQKLKKSGFTITKMSYINMVLAPIGIANHFYEKLTPPKKDHSSIHKHSRLINTLGELALGWEKYALRFVDLPFGLGIIAVCKKNK